MDIEAFTSGIARLKAHFDLQASSRMQLGDKLLAITTRAHNDVAEMSQELKAQWPNSPLLIEISMFKALGIESKEVPLTRALAWWLGGCDCVKSALLEDSRIAALRIMLSDRSLGQGHFSDWSTRAEDNIDGRREDGRVDILLRGKIDGQEHCVAIEAKITAQEGPDQLSRYASKLKSRYGGARHHIVFLTPDERWPTSLSKSDDLDVKAISYGTLLFALLPVLKAYDDRKCNETIGLVEFGRLLMADLAVLSNVHIGGLTGRYSDVFSLQALLKRVTDRGEP